MTAPSPIPALPDAERRTSYSITSQTGPFAVNFALYGDGTDFVDWVEVWLNSVQLTVLDFTLTSPSGSIATLPRPITDAVITLTAASTGNLQIVGARRPRRTSQFAENQGVTARDLNQVFTDVIAQMREGWDRMRTRMFAVPAGELPAQLPKASLRANKLFAFDGSGSPLMQAVVPVGGLSVIQLTLTRAQIAGAVLALNTLMVSGFSTAGDLGTRAIYTSVGAGPSGPMAIQDLGGTWFNLVVHGKVNLGWFGVDPTGVSDATAAIQAAIDACAAANGGKVVAPPGTFKISSTININNSNVALIGPGADGAHDLGTGANPATVFNWAGGASPMIKVATIYNAGAAVIGRCQVSGIRLDGFTVATIGLLVDTVRLSTFADLYVVNTTQSSYKVSAGITGTNAAEAADSQGNVFRNCTWRQIDFAAVQNAHGMHLTGSINANTSFNRFEYCEGQSFNGHGFAIENADNNVFIHPRAFIVGGTGKGIRLSGTSAGNPVGGQANVFIDPSYPPGGCVILGAASGFTAGTINNSFYSIDTSNGSDAPVMDPDCSASYTLMGSGTYSAHFGSTVPTIVTGASYGVTVSDSSIIANHGGTLTLTLPDPAIYRGRWLNLKTVTANTVVSASSNVVPQIGGAAGTAILAATAGKWAKLQSTGGSWEIMESG